MDKDLKDIITYAGGVVLIYAAFIGALAYLIKDKNLIVIYTLFLTIFLWLAYLQVKINKNGGKNNDKR